MTEILLKMELNTLTLFIVIELKNLRSYQQNVYHFSINVEDWNFSVHMIRSYYKYMSP